MTTLTPPSLCRDLEVVVQYQISIKQLSLLTTQMLFSLALQQCSRRTIGLNGAVSSVFDVAKLQ